MFDFRPRFISIDSDTFPESQYPINLYLGDLKFIFISPSRSVESDTLTGCTLYLSPFSYNTKKLNDNIFEYYANYKGANIAIIESNISISSNPYGLEHWQMNTLNSEYYYYCVGG